jgi:hypothetical protein
MQNRRQGLSRRRRVRARRRMIRSQRRGWGRRPGREKKRRGYGGSWHQSTHQYIATARLCVGMACVEHSSILDQMMTKEFVMHSRTLEALWGCFPPQNRISPKHALRGCSPTGEKGSFFGFLLFFSARPPAAATAPAGGPCFLRMEKKSRRKPGFESRNRFCFL